MGESGALDGSVKNEAGDAVAVCAPHEATGAYGTTYVGTCYGWARNVARNRRRRLAGSHRGVSTANLSTGYGWARNVAPDSLVQMATV